MPTAPSQPRCDGPLKVLNVEDVPRDSALIEREFRKRLGPVELVRVDTSEGFAAALARQPWDIIIADHRLPSFSSLAALEALRAAGLDIPLVVVSGTMGVEFAVEAMRAGARDYLVKSDLVRLPSVVEREVGDALTRRQVAARHRLRGEALEILNSPGELVTHLAAVLELIHRHAGADAAAIRLRVDGDYPYVAQVGFESGFLASEQSLCAPGRPGCEASAGPGPTDPGCLCGAVLLQHPGRPTLLTRSGAFVTGRLEQALASAGPLAGARGRCVRDGYASLALLPLRSGPEVVGLLQLNARAPERFDGPLIQFLEEIGGSVGMAIERRRAEEALRASEVRYRVLVETSPDGVALVDPEGTVLMANRRLAALLGVNGAKELAGKMLTDFVAEEDQRRVAAALARSQQPKSSDAPVRFRHGAAAFDGEITPAALDREGDAARARVVVVRDVTEQRKLQARLAQADRMASVGMLAAGVAHEINNPLTYVLANLEGLAADLPDLEMAAPPSARPPELLQRVREALDGARRIREIVRDLRVFSRSSDDRLQAVELNQVIAGAINMTRGEIKYRARLVEDFGKLQPVWANEGRLAQVFLNLLVNAAQAIPEGDADRNRIEVRTWSESGAVLAEVRDTGVGIPAEIQERIFDPFFTTKPAGIGTGLGLAISRGIVEELGGRISVQSRPGEGTRFVVQLPVAPAATDPPASKLAPEPAVARGRSGRILLVDDETLIRAALARLLRGEHEVVEAASGSAAEAVLSADEGFDVILCDLVMPEMTGMELHERLSSGRPGLARRMVFMTGGAFTERAVRFLEAVPNARLEKPVDLGHLRELVRTLVAERGLEVVTQGAPRS